MNIHCSACGAALPQGARFCPACALPLTAIAIPTPAPPRKKPVSILAICIVAIVALIVICNLADSIQRPKEEAAANARTAAADQERARQFALVQSLTTPQAFEQQCGKPSYIETGVLRRDISEDYPAPSGKHVQTLIYQRGPAILDVILIGEADPPFFIREHANVFRGRFHPMMPYKGLIELQCKGAQ